MEFLLSLSANIDWHIIIYVLSQSPEKVMIFLFILMFSSPWLPFLEPVFTPTTFHRKEKKPEKIQVFYKVLCSSSYLLSLIFMSAIIKHTCILEILLSLCNKCLLELTSTKFNNESSKLLFPPVCVCLCVVEGGKSEVFQGMLIQKGEDDSFSQIWFYMLFQSTFW